MNNQAINHQAKTEAEAWEQAQKAFNDTIRNALDDGATINAATMGGSQGEIARIDLRTDSGKKITRVALEHYYGDVTTGWKIVKAVHAADDRTTGPNCRKVLWEQDAISVTTETYNY